MTRPLQAASARTRASGPLIRVALALLVVVAAALRMPYPIDSFTDDPPYHLLRVQRLLTAPVVPTDPDPLTAWPHGDVTCWPWGFDWLVAGLVRPLLDAAPSPQDVARACAPIPPLLGALLVPLVFLLGRRLRWAWRAVAAAGLVAVLPIHIAYSVRGRVDHHVTECLFLALACLGPLGADTLSKGRRRGVGWALVASGLAATLSSAFAPGAIAWSLPAVALLGLGLAARRTADEVPFLAGAVAGALAALVASPTPLAWSFFTPSLFQVSCVIGAAIGGCMAGMLSRRRPGLPFAACALAGGAAVLLLATLAALALPQSVAMVSDAIGYVTKSGGIVRSEESRSLFADPTSVIRLGTWLAPLAIVGIASWALRDATPIRRSLAALGLALVGLAAAQQRFLVPASPVLALAVVEGAAFCWHALAGRIGTLGIRPAFGVAAAGAVVALALSPAIEFVTRDPGITPWNSTMQRVAALVGPRVPPDGGGLLTLPAYGQYFKFWTGVGTVCDNFWGVPANDEALRACSRILLETDPDRAGALLDEYRIRWLVLPPPDAQGVTLAAREIGLDPASFVAADGRPTALLGRTLWVRLGTWAVGATPGRAGPHGLRLLEHVVTTGDEGQALAEVMVLERPLQAGAQPGSER